VLAQVSLEFELREDGAAVRAVIVAAAAAGVAAGTPLRLHGSPEVTLVSVTLDGAALAEGAGYSHDADGGLVVTSPPAGPFTLRTEVALKPQDNTSLEGLYLSSGNFCTQARARCVRCACRRSAHCITDATRFRSAQCEAESFRKITFFPDRPDVLTRYTTRIEAPKAAYPVLLGNGNLTASGDLPDGRHFAVWHDPWPKPCYLFALVAGNLIARARTMRCGAAVQAHNLTCPKTRCHAQALEDSFVTASGRNVALRIYTQAHNADKTAFAMRSLKARHMQRVDTTVAPLTQRVLRHRRR
jgi:aminopeptidase N